MRWWAVTAAGCCCERVCTAGIVGRASDEECRATWPATAVCLHRPATLFESESSNYYTHLSLPAYAAQQS